MKAVKGYVALNLFPSVTANHEAESRNNGNNSSQKDEPNSCTDSERKIHDKFCKRQRILM